MYTVITKCPLSGTVSQPVVGSKKEALPKNMVEQGFLAEKGFPMGHKDSQRFRKQRVKERAVVGEETMVQMGARAHTHTTRWDKESAGRTWTGELRTDRQALECRVVVTPVSFMRPDAAGVATLMARGRAGA